jgi:predicted HNH restriction endonuclease
VAWHSPEYKRYLKSPEWAERKRRYYAIHHRRCAACGTWKKIHFHHSSYERLTREPDTDLWPLCFSCHRNVHRAFANERFRDLEAATIFIVNRGQARR